MSLDNIIAGDYGQVIKLTFIDVDTDAAADISAYSTAQQMIVTDPDGNISAALVAAFDTDGTDGVISYTLASGVIDAAGVWKIRGRVTSGTAELTTEEISFRVLADTVPA